MCIRDRLHKHGGSKINITLQKLHVELDEVGIVEQSSKLGDNKILSIETKSLKKTPDVKKAKTTSKKPTKTKKVSKK